ncbi:DUF3046 domain-containing protein [Mycolicibacterium fluoranthenivorans]|uniref:DUF3046 domain-containing protein n=1 Tax=Mycolicibacterium fluoranthenivorans TaxID=258505 RepID=A0A7G8PMY6_9MYCO|nr:MULTISPECIES: DUF3046 domain-containing protein [Mycobacteriaceae]MCV7251276.1 DUF3046 domain-containing protein [Mycobacterium hackensackense]QNJ95702.1 DUF3046 domain-containing protein [Mycolicibacterium fluoranthenivorans]
MRLTEFNERVTGQFGAAYGASVLVDHVLSGIGRTAAEAIEAGVDPRDVWRALCADFEVPRDVW